LECGERMNRETIVLNPQLAWREIEGHVVVISPEDSVVHELNETASFIWKQASNGRSLAEIARSVSDEYGVDAAQARKDAEELLAALSTKGLLVN
jgi:Coenzyme PQQ synthesis protein D (PqqD)